MIGDEARLRSTMDAARQAYDFDVGNSWDRYQEYLNWYSPVFDSGLLRHDAWDEGPAYSEINTTRNNFPICRAVVDIWTSLEAGTPPSSRAEPERVPLPPPTIDEAKARDDQQMYAVYKSIASRKADMRSALIRKYRRLDGFMRKNYVATKRKNLYGISWVKVMPDMDLRRPVSGVLKNPSTIYPFWSTRDPDDIESLLCAYQESASLANARYGLGLKFRDGQAVVSESDPEYRDMERWFDTSRTMVWVEEYWWIEREFDRATGRQTSSCVYTATRVCDKIVATHRYEGWRYIPFVMFRNSDERSSTGWSDIAGVMDINDEINKRLSQQADVISLYSQPRFQLIGSTGMDREMPDPFMMISLSETERIEQILTRIDVFPTQSHIDSLLDLLSRVSGLPPIVWGLIANAQTSGRALTASWKATETRLSPKLMEDENSIRRWDAITVDYIRKYGWDDARSLFTNKDGTPFLDFTYDFPPMEPRDFQEVTMNAITKRDAGLQTTEDAMREVGDERASDTLEAVRAEWQDAVLHPDKVQAFTLLQQAELQNEMTRQQMAAPPAPQPGAAPAAGAPPGAAGGSPPPGVAPGGPPAPQLSSGTLMRGGDVSNQLLQTQQLGPPPTAGPPA